MITDVHHLTGAARSTIGRWLRWYRDEGVGALEALPAGRAPVLPVAKIVTLLVLLMQFSPQDFGYQRSRWCTEGVVSQISQQVMTSPAPGHRYNRGFLTGRPRVFIDGRPGLPSLQSMTVS